jgi:hypothetical protein
LLQNQQRIKHNVPFGMGGQVELRIMNIEVYFLVCNSEFNIRYSIFSASAFQGAMNRAPTILYDESRPYRHGTF